SDRPNIIALSLFRPDAIDYRPDIDNMGGVSATERWRERETTMSSYSIEGHDGVISGEGIQVYRTAAEAAQHHANRTGESWYVIDDETGEREEFAPEAEAG